MHDGTEKGELAAVAIIDLNQSDPATAVRKPSRVNARDDFGIEVVGSSERLGVVTGVRFQRCGDPSRPGHRLSR
jgi:hypothetical protein